MRGWKCVVKQKYCRNTEQLEKKRDRQLFSLSKRSVRSRKPKVANIKEIQDYRRQLSEKTRKKAGNVRQGAVNSENSFDKKSCNQNFLEV